MNPWPWFFLILLPMFVVSVKPGAPGWLYIGRLLAAILVGYVLLNLMIHTHHRLESDEYKECVNQVIGEKSSQQEECNANWSLGNGLQNVFYMYLGWIPAYGYVGLWEWIWRKRQKQHIQALANAFQGNEISCFLIIISSPVILCTSIALVIGLFYFIGNLCCSQ